MAQASATIQSDDLKKAQSKFVDDLTKLASASDFYTEEQRAEQWLSSAFEFGRIRHLVSAENIPDKEKSTFLANFPAAVHKLSSLLRGITSMMRSDNFYTAKIYASSLQFLRSDILKLYEETRSASLSDDLKKDVSDLGFNQKWLLNELVNWRYPGYRGEKPNEREKPASLEGIPIEHTWWDEELRRGEYEEKVNEEDEDW